MCIERARKSVQHYPASPFCISAKEEVFGDDTKTPFWKPDDKCVPDRSALPTPSTLLVRLELEGSAVATDGGARGVDGDFKQLYMKP